MFRKIELLLVLFFAFFLSASIVFAQAPNPGHLLVDIESKNCIADEFVTGIGLGNSSGLGCATVDNAAGTNCLNEDEYLTGAGNCLSVPQVGDQLDTDTTYTAYPKAGLVLHSDNGFGLAWAGCNDGDIKVYDTTFPSLTDGADWYCQRGPPWNWRTPTDNINFLLGNVGIGEIDPVAKLDVRGDVNSYGYYVKNNSGTNIAGVDEEGFYVKNSSGDNQASLKYLPSFGSFFELINSGTGEVSATISGTPRIILGFGLIQGSFRGGNIGIGTPLPAELLEVFGDQPITTDFTRISINNPHVAGGTTLILSERGLNEPSEISRAFVSYNNETNKFNIGTTSTEEAPIFAPIVFKTQNTERMRVSRDSVTITTTEPHPSLVIKHPFVPSIQFIADPPGAFCGDDVCNIDETFATCSADCLDDGSGDGGEGAVAGKNNSSDSIVYLSPDQPENNTAQFQGADPVLSWYMALHGGGNLKLKIGRVLSGVAIGDDVSLEINQEGEVIAVKKFISKAEIEDEVLITAHGDPISIITDNDLVAGGTIHANDPELAIWAIGKIKANDDVDIDGDLKVGISGDPEPFSDVDATGNIAAGVDITAGGNIAAGGDIIATGNVGSADGNVVARYDVLVGKNLAVAKDAIVAEDLRVFGDFMAVQQGLGGVLAPEKNFKIEDALIFAHNMTRAIDRTPPLGQYGYRRVLIDDETGELYRGRDRVTPSSSKKFKKDIIPLEADFYKLLQVSPVSFRYNGQGKEEEKTVGYIAEDFKETGLDNLLTFEKDGSLLGIKYEQIPIYMLELIKEQQKEIDELKEIVCKSNSSVKFCENFN